VRPPSPRHLVRPPGWRLQYQQPDQRSPLEATPRPLKPKRWGREKWSRSLARFPPHGVGARPVHGGVPWDAGEAHAEYGAAAQLAFRLQKVAAQRPSFVCWRKKRRPHGHLAEVGEDGRLRDEAGREVLRLEAELLQQQHEERRDRQRKPAGEVGDEEHEVPGGEIAVGRGTDMDPSSERRHTPSEQVAHQVECHLGLEALGRV
jgi:hypothetical protein